MILSLFNNCNFIEMMNCQHNPKRKTCKMLHSEIFFRKNKPKLEFFDKKYLEQDRLLSMTKYLRRDIVNSCLSWDELFLSAR